MSNRLVEGFDWFPPDRDVTDMTNNLLVWNARQWIRNDPGQVIEFNVLTPYSFLPGTAVGRFGYGRAQYWQGYHWEGNSAGDSTWTAMDKPIGAPINRGFIGMAIKLEPFVDPNQGVYGTKEPYCMIQIRDARASGNNTQLTLVFDVDGVIRLFRGRWSKPPMAYNGTSGYENGTLVASSYAGAYSKGVWFYLEIGVNCATSGGNCEVRINTVPVINFTGNTSNAGTSAWDTIGIGWIGNYTMNFIPGWYFDDMYVNDDQGSTCNGFMGNVRVQTQFPDGPGDKTQFSIGGSSPPTSNWEAASNKNLNEESYVEATAAGTTDLYNLQSLVSGNAIYAVQASMVARQVDTLQVNAHSVIKTGGVEYEGVDHFLNSSFSFFKTVWELNPNTGAAWTQAELAALQLGPKKVN